MSGITNAGCYILDVQRYKGLIIAVLTYPAVSNINSKTYLSSKRLQLFRNKQEWLIKTQAKKPVG